MLLKICQINLVFIFKENCNHLFVSQVRAPSELLDFGQMSWDDLFNLDLDEILSVAPASEPEPKSKAAPEVGKAELSAAKTAVANVHELSVCQISNLSEVIEAADLLISSSITEDQKMVLANLRDQLPFLVFNVKSAIDTEEENAKKQLLKG